MQKKSLNDFKFGTFIGRFPSGAAASMAVKGLMLCFVSVLGTQTERITCQQHRLVNIPINFVLLSQLTTFLFEPNKHCHLVEKFRLLRNLYL